MTSRRSRRKLCWRTTFRRGSGTRFQERDTRRRTRGQISRRYSQSAIHGGLVDQRSRRISRLCAATARFWWPSPGTSRTPGRLACTRRGGPRRDSASTPQNSKRPVARMSCSAGSPSSPASPGRSRAASPPTRRADARAAIRVCAVSGFVAFAFLELAFWVDTFAAFAVLFFLGQAFAFGVQAPVNAVVLRSVRASERPLACSLVTVIIHALGDVPTPPLFGLALEGPPAGPGAPTPRLARRARGVHGAHGGRRRDGPRGGGDGERGERGRGRSPPSAGSPEALASPAASSEREGTTGDDASGASFVHPGGDRGFESASVPFVRRRGGKRRGRARRGLRAIDRAGRRKKKIKNVPTTKRRPAPHSAKSSDVPRASRCTESCETNFKKKNGGRADAGHCVARSASAARPRLPPRWPRCLTSRWTRSPR